MLYTRRTGHANAPRVFLVVPDNHVRETDGVSVAGAPRRHTLGRFRLESIGRLDFPGATRGGWTTRKIWKTEPYDCFAFETTETNCGGSGEGAEVGGRKKHTGRTWFTVCDRTTLHAVRYDNVFYLHGRTHRRTRGPAIKLLCTVPTTRLRWLTTERHSRPRKRERRRRRRKKQSY